MLIATMKNIKAQSFRGHDFFTHPIINQNEQVKFKPETFRNQYTQSEWLRVVRHKTRYLENLTGITIPLDVKPSIFVEKARVVISWPDALGDVQLSIQFLCRAEQKWVVVPCKTNTVCDTFYGLFPETIEF